MDQNCVFEEFESRDHKFREKSVDQNCDGMCMPSRDYLLHILFWTTNNIGEGRPIIPAISVKVGTIYACNFDFLNRFLTQDDHFQDVLKIFEIAGIYGPYQN